ncbi:MAG: hypothetical protein RMY28_009410 [Nostoc sp. ChiSLP01]|nr:hypothetical protein [Nostoc sp. CmiSLP01]MDZ8285228.1 hypothetical protein [Nostoc sp. ChiSLP01]
MGFENGNDSTGTIPTYLIGGVDSSGKVKAFGIEDDGGIKISSGSDRPSITTISGTISSSGDNTIIAAPGSGLSINLCYLKIQLEGTTATTVLLKSGGTTKERILCQNQGDGLAINYPQNRELRLDVNTALILNLSGANSVNYAFHYFVT